MEQELITNCPVCNKKDRAYKVSILYMEGLNWQKMGGSNPGGGLGNIMEEFLQGTSDGSAKELFVSRLVTLLSPPAGKKRYLRDIHPDHMAGFFLIISVIIILRGYLSQPMATPIIIGLLVTSFLVYGIFRRNLLERYNQKITLAQHEFLHVENSISKWMRIYYCARDQCIFDPLSGQHTSLDQLTSFFRQD